MSHRNRSRKVCPLGPRRWAPWEHNASVRMRKLAAAIDRAPLAELEKAVVFLAANGLPMLPWQRGMLEVVIRRARQPRAPGAPAPRPREARGMRATSVILDELAQPYRLTPTHGGADD